MEIKTASDINMVGKALAAGWLDGFEDRRRKAVHDLFDVVENSGDEEMRIKAFIALVRADAADLKRQEVAIKKQAVDDARRLRLLELVKQLPPGVLARIAAGDAAFAEGGREGSTAGPDGPQEGV
jgi:hypothetical protein